MAIRDWITYVRSGLPPFNILTLLIMVAWTFVFYQVIQVWWIQREPPSFIYEERIVDSKAVQRGGILTMEIKLLRTRPCTTVVTRYIQDSDGVRSDLPVSFSQAQKVGYEHYTRQFFVPDYLTYGPAGLYVTSSYNCHWSHVVWPVIVTRSFEFTITAE